jgi:peptidoglycan-N-acetylglucosamine deacetylase
MGTAYERARSAAVWSKARVRARTGDGDVVMQRTTGAKPNLFLFSIDYEDVRSELVDGFDTPDRLPVITARYLEFLNRHRVTATFFVCGDTAVGHPELIRDILSAGHEVGCHGWRHIPLERYQPPQFKDDISKSLDCLYKAGASRVAGFRAPYLSLTERCGWAYEVLADLGFLYSSSVLPGRNPLYGWPSFGPDVRRMAGVYELPVSVASFLSFSVPFASGASFRALPWFALRALFNGSHDERRPLIGYFHPQDIDTEQATLKYADHGRVGNMMLRYNRGTVLDRLGAIFEGRWRAMPYIEYVERYLCRADET